MAIGVQGRVGRFSNLSPATADLHPPNSRGHATAARWHPGGGGGREPRRRGGWGEPRSLVARADPSPTRGRLRAGPRAAALPRRTMASERLNKGGRCRRRRREAAAESCRGVFPRSVVATRLWATRALPARLCRARNGGNPLIQEKGNFKKKKKKHWGLTPLPLGISTDGAAKARALQIPLARSGWRVRWRGGG